MELLALAGVAGPGVAAGLSQAAETGAGLTINLFWIIVSALNFVVFFALVWNLALKPISGLLEERRTRIERGLRDADAARREREAAADERAVVLAEARREANDILARAQRNADDVREQELATTKTELERLRDQAAAEIQAERDRAIAEVRAQVADLALQAAGKVVGETLSTQRERRLVEEFLAEVGPAGTP